LKQKTVIKAKEEPKQKSSPSIFDDLDFGASTSKPSPKPTPVVVEQVIEKFIEKPVEKSVVVEEKTSKKQDDFDIFSDPVSKKKTQIEAEKEKEKTPVPSIFDDPTEQKKPKKKPAPKSLFD